MTKEEIEALKNNGFYPTALLLKLIAEYEQLQQENEKQKEILAILKENALIQKNGDGYTITIWLNTANCGYGVFETRENVDKIKEWLKNE